MPPLEAGREGGREVERIFIHLSLRVCFPKLLFAKISLSSIELLVRLHS